MRAKPKQAGKEEGTIFFRGGKHDLKFIFGDKFF